MYIYIYIYIPQGRGKGAGVEPQASEASGGSSRGPLRPRSEI